ncbi:hypothetical protein [Streptomyces sp. HB2AG]|uniref:hypothetical protein n=1 Tax=Streptomyces sp. HB2AG TaxID=2983400 RepID=UPI0022AB4DFC|nr:hypothetical protein [Streptomyces sp. HB2AG]MCZ2526148.1 hypothetical protein [Streptomyces sp. HB2AG]
MATAAQADAVQHAVVHTVPGPAGTATVRPGPLPRVNARPRTRPAPAAENTPEGN